MTYANLEAFNRKIRIRKALEQGVSPKQIAEREGVSIQYVSNVKHNRHPTSLFSSLDRARKSCAGTQDSV